VSSTSFTRDEIRAAAETHNELGRELGHDYQAAVIDSFLDKVGREIDARVDARMTTQRPARPARGPAPFALAVVSLALGIPLTAIAAGISGLSGLLVVWIGITAINMAYALQARPPAGRR
jgi:hypothetical protein